ncbi:MAG: hypothetical protein J5779_01315 [Clostridia bacterium]|nr:hypothetical protein [Clostridia bacterium]
MKYIVNFEGSPVKYVAETQLNLKVGDDVVCENSKGLQIGKILGLANKIPENQEETIEIKKLATDAEKATAALNKKESERVFKLVKKKAREENLEMKIDEVFISLDKSKTTIFFTSEDRVDFRNLVKELAAELKTRIELKQIGARDEVRCMGGFGPCGKVCCCKEFINDFEHVTIKMAKTQNLSLNPTKISGLCGRLMCCLGYENNHYAETAALMPKINTEVNTPNGKGVVSFNDLIKRQVTVKFGTDMPEYKVYDLKEISWNKK